MELIVNQEPTLGNAPKSAGFKIAASSKAFQILSSGIYQYKIRAIVRELLCNATDAHIFSGQTLPVELNVPTEISNEFSVRDFGLGLSNEDIESVYVEYFTSTKNTTNLMEGAFGLGAKSPFSYTDSFFVTSFFEGTKTIYNMFIKEGEPNFVKMAELPMEENELTGIEVKVPVQSRDIQEFEQEIKRILRPFDKDKVKIDCTEISDAIDWFCDLADFNKKYFYHNSISSSNRLQIIYGNTIYPLPISDLEHIEDEEFQTAVKWLSSNRIDCWIRFELGELLPQPSRETLQYDERTTGNIIKTLKDCFHQELAKYEEKFKDLVDQPREIERQIYKLPQIQRDQLTLRHLDTREQFGSRQNEFERRFYKLCSKIQDSGYSIFVYNRNRYRLKKYTSIIDGSYGRSAELRVSDLLGIYNKRICIFETNGKLINKKLSCLDTPKCKEDPKFPNQDEYIIRIGTNWPEDIKLEFINLIKEIFAGDPILELKDQDFIDLMPKKEVRVKTKETRPLQLNVYKYVYNKSTNRYDCFDLFLTLKEVDEITGLVAGRYFDQIVPLSVEFKSDGISLSQIVSVARAEKIEEFHVVRSNLFKRILKSEKVSCIFEYLVKLFLVKVPESPVLNRDMLLISEASIILDEAWSRLLYSSENKHQTNYKNLLTMVKVINDEIKGSTIHAEFNQVNGDYYKAQAKLASDIRKKYVELCIKYPLEMFWVENSTKRDTNQIAINAIVKEKLKSEFIK